MYANGRGLQKPALPARTKIRCFLFGIMLVVYYSLLVCFCNLKHCKIYKQYVKFYMDSLNNKSKEHLLSMPRNGTSPVPLKLLACHLDCVCLSPPSPHQITTVLNFVLITPLFFVVCVCVSDFIKKQCIQLCLFFFKIVMPKIIFSFIFN